jgi:acetyltransferase-like isoleucine patch superfamily enzyme
MIINYLKKLTDYLYLRYKGVDTKYGYCRLVGYPKIVISKGSNIKIEKGVTIVSKTNGNIAGVYGRTILASIGENSVISIGKGAGLSGARIVSVCNVTIGQNSGLGVNATIYDTDFHPTLAEERLNQTSILDAKYSSVVIGDQVMVGANSIILKGVTIPDRCVIGAGSVVTRPFSEEGAVYAGNPAQYIKSIYNE